MIIYMNITGIRGTGGGARPGWIWVEKVTFGFERGAATESEDETPDKPKKPDLQAIVIEKPSDAASAALARWMGKGDARTVKLEFCVNSATCVMRCTLEKARLRTYRAEMSTRSKEPFVKELISIDYTRIDVEYKQYDVDNSTSSGRTQFQYDAESS